MAQNYYCKWCGLRFDSVAGMVHGSCSKNPTSGGKHELYEGTEKSEYICKFCGGKFLSIAGMRNVHCPKHPNRSTHEPAL